MPLVPFRELMDAAERGNYAVGYFESWNLESLQAVADAAQAIRSPVILGFSGLYLPDPGRVVRDRLSAYAALGLAACNDLAVPACLLFNESPYLPWVFEAMDRGFNLVMYSDENMAPTEEMGVIQQVVERARATGAAVEAEVAALPGVGGELTAVPEDRHLTDPDAACSFAKKTGVDALAVNIGQVHLHGRSQVRLDFERLSELHRTVPVPLVLHGATSVDRQDLAAAARQGVRKINVGSVLKRTYFEALREAAQRAGSLYNPYEVLGSGLDADVMVRGRVAMQQVVEDLMRLFGSAGQA